MSPLILQGPHDQEPYAVSLSLTLILFAASAGLAVLAHVLGSRTRDSFDPPRHDLHKLDRGPPHDDTHKKIKGLIITVSDKKICKDFLFHYLSLDNL